MSGAFDRHFDEWGIINASTPTNTQTRTHSLTHSLTHALTALPSLIHSLMYVAVCMCVLWAVCVSMLPRVYYPPLKDNLYERRAASITAQLFASKHFGIGH